MPEAYIEKTQAELGPIIAAPKLTEKLLSKPPFRFLHDIVTSFIKATGFPEGLYPEEMLDSSNTTEKDKKLKFLTLLITVVEAATGTKPSAQPSKIIAGQEPEKTNELLQLLATCANLSAEKKTNAVKKAKAGDSAPVVSKSEEPKTSSSKDEEKERKEEERRKRKEEEKKADDEAAKKREAEEKKKRKKAEEEEEKALAAAEAEKHQKQKEEEKSNAKQRDTDEKKRRKSEDSSSKKGDETRKKDEDESKKKRSEAAEEKSSRNDDEERRRRHEEKRRREKEAAEREELTTGAEENNTALLSRSTRPEMRSSISNNTSNMTAAAAAGKAPPRTKPTHEIVDGSSAGAAPVAGVIRESKRQTGKETPAAEEEIENWMRIAEQQEAKSVNSHTTGGVNSNYETEAKGYLGQQALKAKREQEEEAARRAKEAETRGTGRSGGGIIIHSSKGGKSGTTMAEGELSKLREQLQLLTKASNPLGKLLESIYDDIDTMARELEMWRSEARSQALAAADARRQTTESLQEIRAQLQNLEDAINDQILKTQNIRRNVINNDNAIAGMVRMIVSPDIAKR